jgi:hypothetical protein
MTSDRSSRFEQFRVYVLRSADPACWSASFRTLEEARAYDDRLHAEAKSMGVAIRTAVQIWDEPVPEWWSLHFEQQRSSRSRHGAHRRCDGTSG